MKKENFDLKKKVIKLQKKIWKLKQSNSIKNAQLAQVKKPLLKSAGIQVNLPPEINDEPTQHIDSDELAMLLLQQDQLRKCRSKYGHRFSFILLNVALSLSSISSKAYQLLYDSKLLILPHLSTLTSITPTDYTSGLSPSTLAMLVAQIKGSKDPNSYKLGLLSLDAMSVSGSLEVIDRQNTTVGMSLDEPGQPATQCLSFVLKFVENSLTLPIANYPMCHMPVHMVSKFLKSSIQRLCELETPIIVLSATWDGAGENWQMFNDFRAKFGQTGFRHPLDPSVQIELLFDPPHIVKISRNSVIHKEVISKKKSTEIVNNFCLLFFFFSF